MNTDQVYGERRLLAQMILVALQDLGSPNESMGGARAVLRDEAYSWFMSRRDCEDLGSFKWVCSHLGLDESWIRRAVNDGTYHTEGDFSERVERLAAFADGQLTMGYIARESGVPVATLYNFLKRTPSRSPYAPILEKYLDRAEQQVH